MNQKEQLLSSFFDDALSSREAKTLAGFLETDPELAREFDDIHAIDRLLAVQFNPTTPANIHAILEQIRAEQQPFVQSILQDINQEAVGRGSRRAAPRTAGSPADLIASCLRFFRSALRPALLCAAALAIIAAFIWLTPRQGTPQISAAQNADLVAVGTTDPIPLKTGYQPQPGDRLLIQTNGSAVLSFGREGTEVTLSAASDFKFISLSRGKQFSLLTGTLRATVARQRPFRPMLIRTPQAEARVLGTKLVLTTDINSTRLDVREGKVRLSRNSDNTHVDVPADHYAIAAPNAVLAALPKTGRILRQVWTQIPGHEVNDLLEDPRYPAKPDARDYLQLLELPTHGITNYGCQLLGYIHPPVTGDYIFWIAAFSEAVFNVSVTEDPADAVRVFGNYFKSSAPRQWEDQSNPRTKYGPIHLVAGRRYYIEVLYKTDERAGHLAIAWTPPGGEREIISNEYLSPYEPKSK